MNSRTAEKVRVERLGASVRYEYVEDGRRWTGTWEARETGAFFPVMTLGWDQPEGEPILPDARERIYDAVWQAGGPEGLLEEVKRFSLWVPVRWNRPSGFLVNVLGGEVQYMELRHTLQLAARNGPGPGYTAFVSGLPSRWTVPEDESIQPDHRAQIVERLRSLKPDDLWIGSHLSWTVIVDEGRPVP